MFQILLYKLLKGNTVFVNNSIHKTSNQSSIFILFTQLSYHTKNAQAFQLFLLDCVYSQNNFPQNTETCNAKLFLGVHILTNTLEL